MTGLPEVEGLNSDSLVLKPLKTGVMGQFPTPRVLVRTRSCGHRPSLCTGLVFEGFGSLRGQAEQHGAKATSVGPASAAARTDRFPCAGRKAKTLWQ